MSFHNEIDADMLRNVADYWLGIWGCWARHGNDAGRLGYGKSVLSAPSQPDIRDESMGEVVDNVIAVLPDEYVSIAVMVYQKCKTSREVRENVGISQATFESRIKALRFGVYVGMTVAKKKLTLP